MQFEENVVTEEERTAMEHPQSQNKKTIQRHQYGLPTSKIFECIFILLVFKTRKDNESMASVFIYENDVT